MRKPFSEIQMDAANDAIFPRELKTKPMAHMTQDELFAFVSALLGYEPRKETDRPENKEFMNDACDALGNNGDPIMPEDLDTFIDETDERGDQ